MVLKDQSTVLTEQTVQRNTKFMGLNDIDQWTRWSRLLTQGQPGTNGQDGADGIDGSNALIAR